MISPAEEAFRVAGWREVADSDHPNEVPPEVLEAFRPFIQRRLS